MILNVYQSDKQWLNSQLHGEEIQFPLPSTISVSESIYAMNNRELDQVIM